MSRASVDPVCVFEYDDGYGITQTLNLADFASSRCLTDQVAEALVNAALGAHEDMRQDSTYMEALEELFDGDPDSFDVYERKEVLSKADKKLAIAKARDSLKSEDVHRAREARDARRQLLQAQLDAAQRGLQELDNADVEEVQGEW